MRIGKRKPARSQEGVGVQGGMEALGPGQAINEAQKV